MSVSRTRCPKSNVCLVQPHPLSVKGFMQKLSGGSRVFVVSDSRALPKDEISSASDLVFIFDQATVTLPIPLCLENLRRKHREPKAILLIQASDPEEQFQFLLLGLKGVVLYKDVPDQLPRAVKSVVNGGYWVKPEVLAQYVLQRSSKPRVLNGHTLTHREGEVLQLLKDRLSNKEIGLKLVLSESTVKFHVAHIFNKLGIHDRQSVLDLAGSTDPAQLSSPSSGSVPALPFRRMRAS
jgi:DNA-binding NarL/FixJ family response regulator